VLVRHGETAWSVDRRHTGRTDVPLSAAGRARAAALGPVLAMLPGVDAAIVRTSPLQRARDTCARAGFGDRAEVWPDLAEWDYGVYEGRRTAEIRESIPGWSVWTHPIEGGAALRPRPPVADPRRPLVRAAAVGRAGPHDRPGRDLDPGLGARVPSR
jgi:probable phosphoglycerate mutase